MINYIIKGIGYSIKELKYDYKLFSTEIHHNLNIFSKKFLEQNNKTKTYKDLEFYITPSIGYNTIILSWAYLTNDKHILLYIPELNKDELYDIIKIRQILTSIYGYNEKQLNGFEEIYNKLLNEKRIKIINECFSDYNLVAILWFGDTLDIKEKITDEIKEKKPIYDIYNLDNFKKEYLN